MSYSVNGVVHNLPYYLPDGIYQSWALFVNKTKKGSKNNETNFATTKEGPHKVFERALGVLKARFHIIRRPAGLWYREDVESDMKACIFMHSMIVEVQRDDYASEMDSLKLSEDAQALFNNGNGFSSNSWETM